MRFRRKTTSGTRLRIRPDGMTLVELMVVLIIMLLVTGAISRLLARAWESQDTIMGQNLMQKYVQQAADGVIADLGELGGSGGVIVATPEGFGGYSFNTPGMYRGMVSSEAEASVAIYGDE